MKKKRTVMMRISEITVVLKHEKLKAMPFQNIEVEDRAFSTLALFFCTFLTRFRVYK